MSSDPAPAAALLLLDSEGTCLYAAGDTYVLFGADRIDLIGTRVAADTAAEERAFPGVGLDRNVVLTARPLALGPRSPALVVMARPAASDAGSDPATMLEAVAEAIDSFALPALLFDDRRLLVAANGPARHLLAWGRSVPAGRHQDDVVHERPGGRASLITAAGPTPDLAVAIVPVAGDSLDPVGRLVVAVPRGNVTAPTTQATRLMKLFSEEADGLVVVGRDARLLHVGRRARDVLGGTPAARRGANLGDVLRPPTGGVAEAIAALPTNGNRSQRVQWRYQSEYGWRPIEVTLTSLLDDPAVEGVVIHLHEPPDPHETSDGPSLQVFATAAVQASSDAIICTDLDGAVRLWNRGAQRMLGWSAREVVGHTIDFLIPPGTESPLATFSARLAAGQTVSYEAPHLCRDNTTLQLSMVLTPLDDGQGRVFAVACFGRDVTEVASAADLGRRLEEEQARQAAQQAVIASLSQRALKGLDLSTLYREAVSAIATTLLVPIVQVHELSSDLQTTRLVAAHGWPGDVAGNGSAGFTPDSGLQRLVVHVGPVVVDDLATERSGLVPDARAHGVVSLAAVIVPGRDRPAAVIAAMSTERRRFHAHDLNFLQTMANIVGTAVDRSRATDEMRQLALHDPLTGLPNRALLLDRLAHALAGFDRHPDDVAVLFADLDHFKRFNDTLGHTVGDELLVTVARRLRQVVRERDTVGRLGGDEFVVLCEELSDIAEAELVAERIRQSLVEPVTVAGHQVVLTASIGVALSHPAATPDDLLRRSDLAMYQAKADGRGLVRLFVPAMDADLGRKVETEQALRRAIRTGGLDVVFEPRVRLLDGLVTGIEAGLVWEHPQWGRVDPADFLGVAEDLGMLPALGALLLDQACAVAAELATERPGLDVAVPLLARQLHDPGLLDTVRETLARHRLEADALVLVVDGSALADDLDECRADLMTLRRLGIRLAVDHFGNSWAALTSLAGLAVDELHVDPGLVRELDDPAASTVASSVISMARAAGLRVIADGVETGSQVEALRQLQCNDGKGSYWCEPVDAEGLRKWLASLDRFRVAVP